MDLFITLTKGKEDQLLYEDGVLAQSGRLTDAGRALVVDLMFQGKSIADIRKLMVEAIKENKKSNQ